MSDLVENLKKLCMEHENHIMELRDKIRTIEYVPKAKALVGRCFKYSNSVGLSNRKFWTYKRVIRSQEERVFVDSFQEDNCNKIEFRYNDSESAAYFNNRSWAEISVREFVIAQNKLIQKILKNSKKRG